MNRWHNDTLRISDINGGDCYNWAWIVHHLIPDAVLCTVRYYGGHAFVKIKNKYYDAEHTSGVIDWRKLNSFKDCRRRCRQADLEIMSVSEFK
jgi:hypothetical protein